MTLISVLFVAICLVYLLFFTWGRWLLNPVPLFVVTHLLMFLGTVPLLVESDPVDIKHLQVLCVGMSLFLLGAMATALGSLHTKRVRARWWNGEILVEQGARIDRYLLALLIVSLVISGVYYYVIGYNIFLLSVVSFFTGQGPVTDVATLRLETYSGDRYLAPGYANQFKNVFLPLITGYFAVRFALTRRRADGLVAAAAAVPTVVALLGTGQRTAFIFAALILIAYANAALPRTTVRKVNIIAGTVFPTVLLLSTVVLGRTVASVGGLDDLGALAMELSNRVTRDQQIGSVVGFRHVASQPVQFGREWLLDLAGILPGQAGSPLPHDVFALLYGTARGTAPVSVWVSMWHNFGRLGLGLVSMCLGVIYELVYRQVFRGPRTTLRLLLFAAVSVLLGVWIAGSPATLINTGVVAVLALYWLTRRIKHTVRPV